MTQTPDLSPPDLSPLEALAAEYVLGTLSGEERADVTRRRRAEPLLDAHIKAWEVRLAPLNVAIAPVAPPSNLFSRIVAALPGNDNLAGLQKQLARWRAAALGAGALAASLFVGVGVQHYASVNAPKTFVALLQKDATSPAFVVSVNVDTRALTIRPVATAAPAGKSYELWIINDKLNAPKSLGIVGEAGLSKASLQTYAPDVVQSGLYAITLEQLGGSPSGQPTSAPIFTGKLVEQ